MKSIGAGVDAVSTQGKKEEEAKVEEEEYTEHRNEMYFYLKELPEYRISAVGRWRENSKGKVVGDADTYFCHIMTGERCESAWGLRPRSHICFSSLLCFIIFLLYLLCCFFSHFLYLFHLLLPFLSAFFA